jgi:hypothetical protein
VSRTFLPADRSIGFAGAGAGAVLFAGALLFAAACGREEVDQTVDALPVEALAVSETPVLEPGTVRVEFFDGRVSVTSNGAQRIAVLRELAEQAGFELVSGDLERQALTLHIEDVALEEALIALLRGVRYGVEYGYEVGGDSHALVRLTVGEPIEVAAAKPQAERWDETPQFESAEQEKLARKILVDLRERTAERSQEELQRLREEHAARAEAMEDELVERIGDPDPSVRAEAVSDLPLGGEEAQGAERLQRLARVAADDPDPQVRIAAVGRLGESDSPGAVDPLVGALDDPDREVVLEALTAVQNRDDASLLPYLEPLLQDPDPEIREKTEFTKEWLQW